jgi:hypothetical protein
MRNNARQVNCRVLRRSRRSSRIDVGGGGGFPKPRLDCPTELRARIIAKDLTFVGECAVVMVFSLEFR